MSENRQKSQICIVINDKSQGSIAKHLSCDGLLHYKFITQFVGERTFNIDEHLAKLLSKWLILLYAPITLHFCPQRCRIRHISKITSVLQTEAVTNCCYVNRQINLPSVLWRCWLGGRKGIRPVKNWVVEYWHGYLTGARCRLAYGPADATAAHCLMLQ